MAIQQRVFALAFLLLAVSAVLYISGTGIAGSGDAGAAGSRDAGAEDEEKPSKKKDAKLYDSGYMDDNESCLVCHLDFKKEKIVVEHLEHGITCAGCHGDSEAHRGDEWNVVRPDVLWGRAEINDFCKRCHAKHKKSKAYDAFVAKWLDKRRLTGRYVTTDSVCTDCHGRHAIIIGENEFK